jgi:hypothetical protein
VTTLGFTRNPTTAAPHQLAQELELFRPQVDCENVDSRGVAARPGGLFCKQVGFTQNGTRAGQRQYIARRASNTHEGARGIQKFSSKNIGKKCA